MAPLYDNRTIVAMSVETLLRIQFAFTVSFHYIYPPLSIGLGLLTADLLAIFSDQP